MSSLVRSLGTLLVLIAVLAGAPAARGGPAAPRPTAIPPLFPPTATATTPPLPCPLAWRNVAAPNPTWRYNHLSGLAALRPDDVWAVGSASGRPLTAHWDGRAWSVVPVSATGLSTVTLNGVTVVGSSEVWAVGRAQTSSGVGQTLILHWDGTAWRQVPSPNPVPGADNILQGVAAVSPRDIWAVGMTDSYPQTRTLIVHWNGSVWSAVPSPNVGTGPNRLSQVAAVAADDVWAVGEYSADLLTSQAFIFHWDGSKWRQVPIPAPALSSLRGVTAVGPDDIWAVGSSYLIDGNPGRVLILHWDGAAWSISPAPTLPAEVETSLTGVTVVTANDVWAVGWSGEDPLTLHWDGATWRQVAAPHTGIGANIMSTVAAATGNDVWAAANNLYFEGNDPHERALMLRYSATCAAPAPPPAGCELPFRDVGSDHPVYSAIQCVYCQAVVDGYNDGTFRPSANLSRGQAAKYLANAIHYDRASSPPGRQTFTDVPPTHPFWLYVEAAYASGLLSGYSDHTFRPDNPVTRGQLAKLVTNARMYVDRIPPTQQTFTDVPPNDPFWLYIERAYAHGIVSGYSDGTFRPGAPVTRGQAAKFISNTFFPGCGPLR